MDAGIYDLYADFGTTFKVTFEYVESDGTPINLNEGVLSFYVKRSIYYNYLQNYYCYNM